MDRRIPSLWHRLALLTLTCALTASCSLSSLAHDERPIPNEVGLPPVLPDAVVPDLIPLIDGAGLFRFPVPNVAAGEVPLDTAVAEAAEFLFYALNLFTIRGSVEGQRGAFIDLPTLVPCSRPQLVRSVFAAPNDSLITALKLQVSDRWMLPFCGTRRTPEVIVAVATSGNSVRFKNGKPVADSANWASAFRIRGVRWEWSTEHMVTAEEAVNEVFAVTGIRATRLPALVGAEQINGRIADQGGSCPVWRVTLERPLRMAAIFSLRRLDLAELYVADSDCPGVIGRAILLAPWAEQPATREFRATVRDSTSQTGFRTDTLLARYNAPVIFESVIIER